MKLWAKRIPSLSHLLIRAALYIGQGSFNEVTINLPLQSAEIGLWQIFNAPIYLRVFWEITLQLGLCPQLLTENPTATSRSF